MKCPTCGSTSLRKNGRPKGRQRYFCKDCGRQFMAQFSASAMESRLSVTNNQFESATLAKAPGIAILLLDVENLKIDINAEKFLASISEYSLQVKIAFANWKNSSLSKYDGELFERGYQLIHVPEGKNSADAQMMTMGAAIGRQYSDAKVVFVCSSDWLLTHLCNGLQNQGLTVYRVKRQVSNILSIENRNTLEVRHYSLEMAREIPQLEGLVEEIRELLEMEHESISQRISQLSLVVSLFEKRCEISVDEKPDILPHIFSQIPDISESNNIATELVENEVNIQSNKVDLAKINSQAKFEQELMKIISNIPVKDNQVFVSLKLVKEKFNEIFGQDMEQMLEHLKIDSSLDNFLKLSPKFRVKKISKSKEYKVAIAQNAQTLNSQIIRSPEALEKALVKIVKVLTANITGGYISISNIGTEFQKQYGNSITKIMKQLKLTSKFPDFLKSCNSLNLKKVGKSYQVAIANH
ncbi:MAG: NYN domain-containing protein [Microcoleaceae cyanobacterium]